MRANKLNIGTWLTAGSAHVAEALLSTQKFDWAAIDLEHTPTSLETVENIFRACKLYNVKALVRLSKIDWIQARRCLDIGAEGIIVPIVEDAEQYSEFLSYLFFPPKGKRGVSLNRANQWGRSFKEYYKKFNPWIIPQIETLKGVKNIDKILKTKPNAIFVGPYDLSASMGKPGDFKNKEFEAVYKGLFATLKKHKVAAGIHVVEPNYEDLEKKIEEGFKFIAFGTDIICMRHSVQGLKTKE